MNQPLLHATRRRWRARCQVITAESGSGTLCVWDCTTGELAVQFERTHGDSSLSTIVLDKEHRRVLTGSLLVRAEDVYDLMCLI